MARMRKIPLRMCLGCRERKNKREMIRIVRTPQGEVLVDPTGKKSGRGAYLCPGQDCLEKVVKNNGLEKALEIKIDRQIIEGLREQLARVDLRKD
ncbi:MAG TPA: YlxR family protein [Clostridia bacterium]|nr:YlxR family protein [Clostridia bacterium]